MPDTLTKKEILLGLYGAGRLAGLKADGVAAYDPSGTAAWRSFQTLWVVVPLWLMSNWPADPAALTKVGLSLTGFLAFLAVQYVLVLLLQLFVIFRFCQQLGCTSRFALFVNAGNWAGLLVVSVVALVKLLLLNLGDSTPVFQKLLTIGLQLAIFIYAWFITHATLRQPPAVALGLTVVQFVVFYLAQYMMFVILGLTLRSGT